jgi:ribonuclease HII
MIVNVKIPKGVQYVIGIDEAGRGPLAGPVFVGAFCFLAEDVRRFRKFSFEVKDSKKLNEKQREAWFAKMEKAAATGKFSYATASSSSEMIDEKGLSFAIRSALEETLVKLARPPESTLVLLDGLLHAPKEYIFQETIIHGDDIEPIISLASIAAKVSRDKVMIALGGKHPEYGFERHKGYGTKEHYEKIEKHGMLDKIHRKSFL